MRRHSVHVALDVGKLGGQVRLRVEYGRVRDSQHVVQRKVGEGEGVGAEEEVLALQQRVEAFLDA